MMTQASWERAIKVTTEVMRARTKRVEESLRPFGAFFNSCAEAVLDGLKSISPLAVKCSISEADIKKISVATLRENAVGFAAGDKVFSAGFLVDRHFNSLLCDAGLGGNGLWTSAVDDGPRPPSKFEGMLVRHFVKTVAENIPKLHQAVSGQEISLIGEDEAKSHGDAGVQDVRCICVKFLVNIVSLSAEIGICFPQVELEAALSASVVTGRQDDARMDKALSSCPFDVEVLLPPQLMDIDAVLALQPDTILRLEAKPHDLAVMKVEGMEVAKGKIRIHPNKIGLLLQ
jgi:flagellar motor switch protein FliM